MGSQSSVECKFICQVIGNGRGNKYISWARRMARKADSCTHKEGFRGTEEQEWQLEVLIVIV